MPIDAASLRGNFIWDAIDRHLVGKRRRRSSGFTDINCPMCVSRGESADRRYRCGVAPSADSVGINCFNCGFKTGWTRGRRLGRDLKEFLRAIGVPEVELARLEAMAALMHRHTGSIGASPTALPPSSFPAAPLPSGARSIHDWLAEDCEEPDFLEVATYLLSRGDDVAKWPSYMWTPSTKDGMNRRLILPFMHEGAIVGYSARAIDAEVQPRYLGSKPPDYLFNNAVLRLRSRKYIVLVEGAFDAIAIDGVGLLGSTLTDRQAAWLRSTGQTVIVVPDQDTAGGKLIDMAQRYGWSVAFPRTIGSRPWWDGDVKDVAEATRRYGRLWTLRSILETATADERVIAVRLRLQQQFTEPCKSR
ncbi:DNA primase [Methylobacterium sp. GXF4]|nr:DNA primase [Methylobacterium sp. GXF4]